MKIKKYVWLLPAAYVSFMFGGKIIEGMSHSEEFIQIINVISPLKSFAYTLTPLVGILDLCIAIALICNLAITKNERIQKFLFVWAILWPFVPASLRYFGGVGEFEVVEVLSISISAAISFLLWKKFW